MSVVGIVNDLMLTGGGAEASLSQLLSSAPREHKLIHVSPENFDTECELYLINNFRRYTKEQLGFLCTQQFVCWWHDVLPVPYPDLVVDLYERSVVNYFMSPLHREELIGKYDLLGGRYDRFLPALVQVDRFHPNGNQEKEGVCWVGSIYGHKGIEEVLLWARKYGETVHFYGDGDPLLINQLKYSNHAVYQGVVSQEQLPELYRHYKKFIHIPSVVEACGRAVIEAYLSGCKMVVNNKVGFFSYSYDFDNLAGVRENLVACEGEFWNEIESLGF